MQDSSSLLPILSSHLGTFKVFANNEYYFFCPFCHHHNPKLAINMSSGRWHCWICNTSGRSLFSLFRKLELSVSEYNQIVELLKDEHPSQYTSLPDDSEKIVLRLPPEYKRLTSTSGYVASHAQHYFYSRGFTETDAVSYNVGFCETGMFSNRIIIPSYDALGQLNFFVGRDFYETNKLKYRNPPVSKNVVGFESRINWNQPVVLCEGVFDAMAIKRNAIPLFGKTLSSVLRQKLMASSASSVYIALDQDAHDDIAKLSDLLLSMGKDVHVVQLDIKDPAVQGFHKMQDIIRTTDPLTFSDRLLLKFPS